MVGLLSVRKIVQHHATCVLQGGAREGATQILPLSTASSRLVCIRYELETMPSAPPALR
jgi:hypothetical protein